MWIATPDVFAMSCGVLVSISDRVLRAMADLMRDSGAGPAEPGSDTRFVETLYRFAIALAVTDSVEYR
jgi:hypothetical protein